MKKIIISILLLVFAVTLPLLALIPLFTGDDQKIELVTPVEHEFELKEAGNYSLWYRVNGIHDGKTFSFSDQIPHGFEISLHRIGDETPLSMEKASMTATFNGETEKAVVNFNELEPGSYKLSLKGFEEARYFSFKKSFFARGLLFVLMLFAGVVLCFILGAIAVLVFIFGLVELVKKSQLEREEADAMRRSV